MEVINIALRVAVGKKDIQKIQSLSEKPPESDEEMPEILKHFSPEEVPTEPDNYRTRLLKYIPAEVVVAYLTLDATIRSSGTPHIQLQWLIFFFCIFAVILYLKGAENVYKWKQLAISTGAFFVWVFAIGGPFVHLSMYDPLYGALLLPMYTIVVAKIEV